MVILYTAGSACMQKWELQGVRITEASLSRLGIDCLGQSPVDGYSQYIFQADDPEAWVCKKGDVIATSWDDK